MSIPVISSIDFFVKDFNKDRGIGGTINTSHRNADNSAEKEAKYLSSDDDISPAAKAAHSVNEELVNQQSEIATPEHSRHKGIQDSPAGLRSILRSPSSTRNSVHHRGHSQSPLSSLLSPTILNSFCDYFSIDPLVYSKNTDTRLGERRVRFSFQNTRHRRFPAQAAKDMDDILLKLDFHDFYQDENKMLIPTRNVVETTCPSSSSVECRQSSSELDSKFDKVKFWSSHYERAHYPFTLH